MDRNPDKKSGLVYHAAERACKRRFEEVEREFRRARQPELPTVENQADDAGPSYMEPGPSCLTDDAAPLSDSEEDSMADASSGAESDDVEEIQVEVQTPDQPYEDLSCEEGLRLWALQTGQTHRSLSLLLGHLRQHFPNARLPKDARTLMNTPASRAPETAITPIAGGTLWYQGVGKCLLSYFRDVQPTQEGFELNFFVDGLPLYKSSRSQFWPILMQVHNVPNTPVMTVAIFCGESKPLILEEFLDQFVDEMNHLFMNGLVIGTRFYWVAPRAIIADAPARAFIKGVKGHNAYSACQKCTIEGMLHGHRMYFAYDAERQPRNHSDFCDGKYPTHVNKRTPLTRLLGCDIVADFVSAEEMHLLYKGVEAKLIDLWIKGFPGLPCYLPRRQQREVSEHLRLLKLPTDYQRKLRDLRYVQLWKASEYRMFLLVAGFVVLEGRLDDAAYQHFMLLTMAVTFMTTTYHRAKWALADSFLQRFVAAYGDVYSPVLVNSNVHNLLHVYEDVRRFEGLKTISAFIFEAFLHDLKKLVHSGRHSLVQAVHRLLELQHINVAKRQQTQRKVDEQSVRTVGVDTIATVREGFTLRPNFRDQWCMANSGKVVRYETATKTGNEITVQGYSFLSQVPAFTEPCLSTEANIYSASMDDLDTGTLKHYPSSTLMCKLAAVQTARAGVYTFVPLTHTYVNEA